MPFQPIHSESDLKHFLDSANAAESLHVEFKQEVIWHKEQVGKPTDPKEVCRDIAQFANTEGGTLLLGVMEGEVGGRRRAIGVKGVDNSDGLRAWLETAITNYLVPNTFRYVIDTIQHRDGLVLAINIPPSVHLLGLWDRWHKKAGIEYLRRRNGGKEWMNPDDVERHIMDGSRAAQLKVKEIFESARGSHAQVELIPPPGRWKEVSDEDAPYEKSVQFVLDPRITKRLAAVDDGAFTLEVAGIGLTVPYAFVEAAWLTADKRPALALRHQIVVERDYVRFASLADVR